MSKGSPSDLPTGIAPKMRRQGGEAVHATTEDGTPLYRVRVWDNAANRQVERVVEGLDEAKGLRKQFAEGKRRSARLMAERLRFTDVAARYLVAYREKRDGTPRPKSSLAKERTCLMR
jgi:hypothetical protein